MENGEGSQQSPLVVDLTQGQELQRQLEAELTRGQELLRQLQAHLDHPSGIDICKSLAPNILSSIEKALRISRSNDFDGDRQHASMDSSRSPRSENSGRAFKDPEYKKRKISLPKWTSQVRVSSGEGVDGPLDDGYNWRKYGQKNIHEAKHPRGYYRCTHQKTRGCPAMKQVQRSNENSSVFEVTYRGAHTCHQSPLVSSHQRELKPNQPDPQEHALLDHQLLLNFQTGLRVKTSGSSSEVHDPASQSFSFPSTPVSCLKPEARAFSSPSTLDNCFISPSFISPCTSESNYFSVSPCRMSSHGRGVNLQASESDFAEIISAANSETNSPLMDMDFMLDPVEFDPSFPFDASSFFPSDF